MINNNISTNKEQIANAFNKFYVNIGPSFSEKIPDGSKDPLSYINKYVMDSMLVTETTCDEIKNIIVSLKNSSSDWDDIHSKVLKRSYNYYFQVLTHIFNLSLTQGIFPQELKLARVIPLYKNEDKMLINNYRPVSVLPLFSKILERLMFNRLEMFINKHDILYKYQFGFRKGYSTTMSLLILVDKIKSALDNGDIVVEVFLDLSKAFDTVNHDILLRKLYKYGIRGVSYNWFKSYLFQRKQYVVFNNTKSAERYVTCGVPQGSILEPLLFLIYMNDMVNVSSLLFIMLFADDTNLFFNDKDINKIIGTVNKELVNMVDWLQANRLSVNVKKTNYIIFSTVGKHLHINDDLKINGKIINKVDSTKFLGVWLDSKMTWSEHINYIRCKISKGIGILCKARKVLNEKTLITLYYSFIYPYLTYCVEVWGGASDCYISSIFKLQKRAIRILASANYRAHTKPIFDRFEILTLHKIYIYQIALFMFNYNSGMLPDIFYSIFTKNKDIHNYETRQRHKLHVQKAKITLYQRSIKYIGVNIWNYFVDKLHTNCSIYVYKHHLKMFLLRNEVLN